MASSCGPFHEEALRRQRVINRKSAALSRLRDRQVEQDKLRADQELAEERARDQRHKKKMEDLRRQLEKGSNRRHGSHVMERQPTADGGFFERVASNPRYAPQRYSLRPSSVMGIPHSAYKEIKGKDKILRDYNLYQGHPIVLWNARAET